MMKLIYPSLAILLAAVVGCVSRSDLTPAIAGGSQIEGETDPPYREEQLALKSILSTRPDFRIIYLKVLTGTEAAQFHLEPPESAKKPESGLQVTLRFEAYVGSSEVMKALRDAIREDKVLRKSFSRQQFFFDCLLLDGNENTAQFGWAFLP